MHDENESLTHRSLFNKHAREVMFGDGTEEQNSQTFDGNLELANSLLEVHSQEELTMYFEITDMLVD